MTISRFLTTAALALTLASCHPEEATTELADMRTIENTEVGFAPVEPPPVLEEQLPLPTQAPGATPTTPRQTPEAKEEALSRRMDLPFAPAIAMDPVDGGKVSITTLTPTAEYKNKIYYFTSAGNRQVFLANPETYVKGQLAKY